VAICDDLLLIQNLSLKLVILTPTVLWT
jgi:hypothetical protein